MVGYGPFVFDKTCCMLGRGIDRIKPHSLRSGVDQVMRGPAGTMMPHPASTG